MVFILLLFFRSIVKLKNRYASNLPTFFHFDENGNYYLISRNKNIIINYIICNKKEYKLFQDDPNHDASNCFEHEMKIDEFDKGLIKAKGAYQFVFTKDNVYNKKIISNALENTSQIVLKNNYRDTNQNTYNAYKNNNDKYNMSYIKYLQENHLDRIKEKKNANISIYINNNSRIDINNFTKENKIISLSNFSDVIDNRGETKEKDEIVVIFQNPKTNLDMNVFPCLITKPLFASIISLILILWLINWVMNFTSTCTIHIFLTLIIIDSLFYFILQSKELYFRNHSDLFTSLMPLRIVFLFIFQVLFFATILMLAKGWFIVHISIGKIKILYCFIYSILLALPQHIFQTNFVNKNLGASLVKHKKDEICSDKEISNVTYLDYFITKLTLKYLSSAKTSDCSDISLWTSKNGWNFALIGIGFVGVIFYYRDLIASIEQSSEYVIAHLMVISESGIDPCTTPIMEKYVIYKGLSWGILIYLGTQQLVVLITQFGENYVAFWVQQLLYDIVILFGIIGAAFTLKLNKKRLNGFMQLRESGDVNEEEAEIDSINANNDDNNQIKNENGDHPQFNNNMFDPIESNDDLNANSIKNVRDSEKTDMNLNDNANSNLYNHHTSAQMNKRIVSRDEIKRFNYSIGHRNRLNSNLDNLNNINDELSDQENPSEGTNEHQVKMVKWEEWMTLPPQPIVSSDNQNSNRINRNSNNN